jgi:hypothetical protein
LAIAKDEQERYYLARRWRRELPERVFYRVPVEFKPSAADFRSIVLVNLFAKHIRQTQAAGYAEYSVTEMLPDLDQLWLTDGEGWRYSSELRIVAYDSTTADQDLLQGLSHGARLDMPQAASLTAVPSHCRTDSSGIRNDLPMRTDSSLPA